MKEEIKKQIEKELEKIKTAIETSSLTELRGNVHAAIGEAKSNIEENLNKFEAVNAEADRFIDPILSGTANSKWTPLIVAAATLIAVGVGVAIGMHL